MVPFALTRLQLISGAVVLVALVTAQGGWQSVAWSHWMSFVVASVIGVVVGNMAMFACLRRGGPRRTQLLVSMNGPFAALLGFLFLGETMSGQDLFGCSVALAGMALAIRYGGNPDDRLEDISGPMWVVVALGLSTALANAIGPRVPETGDVGRHRSPCRQCVAHEVAAHCSYCSFHYGAFP